MFSSYDIKEDKHTLIFIAGFHLGIPLAICKTKKSIGWEEIREELKESFRVRSSLFKVVSVNYETETSFPLGKPLTIQYLNFFKVVNLPEYFQKPRFSSSNHQYELDNLIWVCPSGVVLVMARISFGIAAILLALISISAVVAQLVSTIDVNSQLGVKERIFLILIGFIIGILSTVGIYILPDRKWYRRLRANKKKRQVKREQK